jgi:hypothetical protein
VNEETVEENFKSKIFIPALVVLGASSFITVVENLLYLLKGCMINNIWWGSYHEYLVEIFDE